MLLAGSRAVTGEGVGSSSTRSRTFAGSSRSSIRTRAGSPGPPKNCAVISAVAAAGQAVMLGAVVISACKHRQIKISVYITYRYLFVTKSGVTVDCL